MNREDILPDIIEGYRNSVRERYQYDNIKLDYDLPESINEETVNDLERRWNIVFDSVTKRQAQIQRIVPNATDYHKELKDVLPWLNNTEKKLALVPTLSANPDELSQRKRELKVRVMYSPLI